jgi:hypothetical protein
MTRANHKGSPGSPHVRHDYSILRRERPKGCVFQVVGVSTIFGRVWRRMADSGREMVRLSASFYRLFNARRRIAELVTLDRRLEEIGGAGATL